MNHQEDIAKIDVYTYNVNEYVSDPNDPKWGYNKPFSIAGMG